MERPHFRPRVLIFVPGAAPEDVCATLKERLKADPGLDGRCTRTSVIAWPAPPARRFWSPCLDANLRAHPGGTVVVGRFGPQPVLFTAFVFSSIGLGFLTCITLSLAFVQSTLGEPMTALGGLVAPLVGALAMVAVDRLGRKRAWTQITPLAALLEGLGEVRGDDEHLLAEVERYRWTEDGRERRRPIPGLIAP